jgi:threonine dehydrogenase-like Zn-dependent dehydrogenase
MHAMTAMRTERQMRIAVVERPRKVAVRRVRIPEPGPGQVRVRLEGCGVCGSNLPIWEGRAWLKYPLGPGAPGREGWGVLDAIGEGVAGLKVGDRVATLGASAFAEFQVLASPDLVRVPAKIDQPFPGEALGCAMNIHRRSDVQAGHTVAIVGIGFLGAILTQLATNAGARVIAISDRPYALEVARRFGAAECLPLEDHPKIVARVNALTEGRLCERVIDLTAAPGSHALTAEQGKRIVAFDQQERDARNRKEGMLLAMDAIVRGELDPRALYTHRFSIDRLGEAFEVVKARPAGFLKALVTF